MPPKKKATPRRSPQKAVALSPDGRAAWDTLKKAVEADVGLTLTNDQVIFHLLNKVA